MDSAVPNPSVASTRFGSLSRRYRAIVELVVAAGLGLVLLPALFAALRDRDIVLGGRVSAVHLVWALLAVIVGAVLLRDRASVRRDLEQSIKRLERVFPASEDGSSDTIALGSIASGGVLDLVLLLVIQAIVRVPVVTLIGAFAPPERVDSAFVVLVVVAALAILIHLHHASRPLTERLVWAALNQLVPTAGFTTPNAATAFATRLSTTTRPRPVAASSPNNSGSDNTPRRPIVADLSGAATRAEGLAETVPAESIRAVPRPGPTIVAEATIPEHPVLASQPTMPADLPVVVEATVAEILPISRDPERPVESPALTIFEDVRLVEPRPEVDARDRETSDRPAEQITPVPVHFIAPNPVVNHQSEHPAATPLEATEIRPVEPRTDATIISLEPPEKAAPGPLVGEETMPPEPKTLKEPSEPAQEEGR